MGRPEIPFATHSKIDMSDFWEMQLSLDAMRSAILNVAIDLSHVVTAARCRGGEAKLRDSRKGFVALWFLAVTRRQRLRWRERKSKIHYMM